MKTFADWHCDTAYAICDKGEHLKNFNGHINIDMLNKYDSPVQIFAVWLHKSKYTNAYNETQKIINYLKNEIELNKNSIALAKSYKDIRNNEGKISAVISIEGCEALEGSIDKLHSLYEQGLRLATLTWNYKNCVATGVMESNLGGGLTDFGKEAVREMERIGIIVDVSHISDEGFYDVVKNTQKPFIASHSNSRTICNAPRNLTDDQLKIIAERGGIAGLNMCVSFLSNRGEADINDILKHTEYMLNLCGENCICFGCDFDGISQVPKGMENVLAINGLLDIMEKEFGKEVTYKIAKGNFMRIMKQLL